MPPRTNFTPNQRYIDEVIHGPRRPPPGSGSDSTSSYNCDTPSDSSSSEGLGAFTTTRSRESASDSDSDPRASLCRRVNQMGGLGRAAEEMFSTRESRVAERAARRAEEDREDFLRRRGEQAPIAGNRRGQITPHADRIGEYSVQTDNYAYHAQVDGNGRLRRLSEVADDGRGHRLSLRRLGRENQDGSSAFSDTDDDEPTAPRGYESRGVSVRGDDYGGGYEGPSTPRGYGGGGGGISARPEQYDDDFEGPPTPRVNRGGRMDFRRRWESGW